MIQCRFVDFADGEACHDTELTEFYRLFRGRAAGKKGAELCGQLVSGHECTVSRIAGSRAQTVAFGRFLNNVHVTPGEILKGACAGTAARVAGLHILAIQDTSELNFEHHADRVTGLGPAGNGSDRGLFVHPIAAVEAGTGSLLGLAGGRIWTRPHQRGKGHRKQLAFEHKESCRWVEVAEQAKDTLAQAAHVTVIADRESDIYEEWARIPDRRTDVLTRASRDRSLAEGGRLFEAAGAWPERAREVLTLRAQPGRPERQAEVAIKYGPVTIKRPRDCRDRKAPDRIALTLIEVAETDDARKDRLHWRLLTTHAVETLGKARQIIAWYRQRWHIEQLFRTLKRQGFNVEDSQMTTGDGLMNLAAMALVAATCVLQLVYERGGKLKRPATDVIPETLYPLVEILQKDREGKTKAQQCPHDKGSLAWLAWVIARLGGWSGYASYKPPGPKIMSQGWKKFSSMAQLWNLTKNV